MSAPRFVVPGTTYLLTRRCFNRQFLLRPSRRINQIFKFCLAIAAARSGCQVHAYCVLSNHYHLVVTDVHGNVPVFMHWLNEYVAKCVNVERGRWESFWAPGSYNAVRLQDARDVMLKLVYTYTNPVTAGLVRSHACWPGAMSLPRGMHGPAEIVRRPTGFFKNGGVVPEAVRLELVPPVVFTQCSQWFHELRERIAARESEIRESFSRTGRRFLGRPAVLRQSPRARPTSCEPRRALNPRVAASNKWRRIESLQRLKGFLLEYRRAWRRFVGGDRSVTFPFGTYAMHVRFGVSCSGP